MTDSRIKPITSPKFTSIPISFAKSPQEAKRSPPKGFDQSTPYSFGIGATTWTKVSTTTSSPAKASHSPQSDLKFGGSTRFTTAYNSPKHQFQQSPRDPRKSVKSPKNQGLKDLAWEEASKRRTRDTIEYLMKACRVAKRSKSVKRLKQLIDEAQQTQPDIEYVSKSPTNKAKGTYLTRYTHLGEVDEYFGVRSPPQQKTTKTGYPLFTSSNYSGSPQKRNPYLTSLKTSPGNQRTVKNKANPFRENRPDYEGKAWPSPTRPNKVEIEASPKGMGRVEITVSRNYVKPVEKEKKAVQRISTGPSSGRDSKKGNEYGFAGQSQPQPQQERQSLNSNNWREREEPEIKEVEIEWEVTRAEDNRQQRRLMAAPPQINQKYALNISEDEEQEEDQEEEEQQVESVRKISEGELSLIEELQDELKPQVSGGETFHKVKLNEGSQDISSSPSSSTSPGMKLWKGYNFNLEAMYDANMAKVTAWRNIGNQERTISLIKEIIHNLDNYERYFKDEAQDSGRLVMYKIHAYNHLALELYNKKDYEDAIDECTKVLELEETNIQALYKMYQCSLKLGNKEQALQTLKVLKELMEDPDIMESNEDYLLEDLSLPNTSHKSSFTQEDLN